MEKQTGIWLDKEKAVIINLKEGTHTIKHLESSITTRERFQGEGKRFGRFGNQFLSMESKKRNMAKNQSEEYLKNIINEIKSVDKLVLFGPAEMKTHLEKAIRKDNLISKKLVAVEAADNMTENQLVAWVKEYYKELS
jgi:stalled ribosome rescue protein Dom34